MVISKKGSDQTFQIFQETNQEMADQEMEPIKQKKLSKKTINNIEEEEKSSGPQKIKIAMLGNVDAGKSTMVGVLTSAPGQLDDGRGAMRANVFNFGHEIETGRTSSVAHEIMGFAQNGEQIIPGHNVKMKNKRWPEIVNKSAKVINFTDLCGHEKYLKTTLHGLTSSFPDYCMIMVGANMKVSKMTKEHIGVANALGLPLIVVFTKMDLAPEEVFKTNLEKMTKIISGPCSKRPVRVRSEKDISGIVKTIAQGIICPIFTVSNITGEGIENLRSFLR